MSQRLRYVLATPICDGHDVAISAVTRLLRREGADAIYIGFNKTPHQIVKAAVEEDASGIAVSSYNGGHMEFFREVLRERKKPVRRRAR
jgi:methylmalonyl-CoA mutase